MRTGLLGRAAVLAALLLVPLRVVGYGYLPTDDALRHAAKVVAAKPWSEILLLRPGMGLDSHPGWHALLGAVRASTGADVHALVLFSVVLLFSLFCLGPALLLRRPEAWLVALVVLAVGHPGVLLRLFAGRPFLVSEAVLVVLCLNARRLSAASVSPALLAGLGALVALATWMHGSWFLFALPVAVFLACDARAGTRLAWLCGAGVLLGALLTGRPVAFLVHAVRHAWLSLGNEEPVIGLALEFQPNDGSALMVVATALFVIWRFQRRGSCKGLPRDPVFMLAATGWTLGYVSIRFWSDWGMPALLVWMAWEVEDAWGDRPAKSWRSLAIAGGASLIAVLALSSDTGGRYSTHSDRSFFGLARASADDLPAAGGVLYSDSMPLFFQLFYLRPHAEWRYVLGYEPGVMPEADLAVYRAVRRARTGDAFAPWVRKMTARDRLILQAVGSSPPPIAGLEWHSVGNGVWSGRVKER